MTRQRIFFLIGFSVVGLIALQIPFTGLVGSNVRFTLFDFFGPIAGGFLGGPFGLAAVALMQLGNFLIHGAQVVDAGTIIRFFPMLFATVYFARKDPRMLLVPSLAILAFVLHPIGRTVWYFALFWLIPILCHFFRDRSLLARSLGTTFTAHAVGGALWIYAFNLPKAVWDKLIPTVIAERLLFTLGIAASYLIAVSILGWLAKKRIVRLPFSLEQKYLLPTLR